MGFRHQKSTHKIDDFLIHAKRSDHYTSGHTRHHNPVIHHQCFYQPCIFPQLLGTAFTVPLFKEITLPRRQPLFRASRGEINSDSSNPSATRIATFSRLKCFSWLDFQ
jgi:hypothetical protein